MTSIVDQVAALLAAGDHEAAQRLVESAARPVDQELGRARLALARGDKAAGAAHARRALEHGGGAAAHHLLAAAALLSGNPDTAIAEARRAIGLDSSPASRASLGSILLAAGRFADCAAVLRQVVVEAPDDADAALNLGTALAKTGDYGDAIVYHARAFTQRPDDPRPIQNLMAMFAEIGRWLGALAALELSRQGEPPPDVAMTLDLVNLHIVRMVAGQKFPPPGMSEDADAAVKNLVAHAAAGPAAPRLIAARTLIDLDRVKEAAQITASIDRATLAPADRASLLYLDGYFAEQRRETISALQLYLQALDADPERVDAAINATSLLLEEPGTAPIPRVEEILGRVAPSRRSDPHFLYTEASVHARAGRAAEARARLEQIVHASGGEGPHAIRAREALAELTRAGR
jgi:tetratricopeptide (TPR) repeat protein